MPFPARLLADHERIVFDLRPHWIAAVPPLLWALAIAAATAVAVAAATPPREVTFVVAAVALAALAWLAVIPFLRWRFTYFVLTSDRLITRHGVISKHSKEIPLERINDVTFTQSVIERILGAGDLMIESAGERGQTLITNVRKPEQVQLTIYKSIESNSSKLASSIAEQLEALHRLRRQGILSESEFEAKRQELMKRL